MQEVVADWRRVCCYLTSACSLRNGRFPGMVARRELRVRLMATPGHAEQARTIHYQGRALALHIPEGTQ